MKSVRAKYISAFAALVLGMSLVATDAGATAKVGEKAPEFELVDTNGKSHKLSSFAGKTVVLEGFNKGCPYVQKHYESQNMQALQKKYTD